MESPVFQQPWPFNAGRELKLERDVQSGALTQSEAAEIEHFADKGYVIFPGAISEELIDWLVRDVRSIGAYPNHFVTTDHRAGRWFKLSDSGFDSYESIFDPYVNFESARKVCFHPRIRRFLELVFEARPLAFQQLLFQRSNQHPIHQDTAYVCAEEPLMLAATWIALEDVVPGRGELTYYEGSHKVPHYLYKDGSKRFSSASDDEQAARRHILEHAERLGCTKRDFIAKKGDVFVWSADLAHGSNPRTCPDEETRMSLVTHYCPAWVKPFWFRFFTKHKNMEDYGDDGLYVSSYYPLPTSGKLTRPTRVPPNPA